MPLANCHTGACCEDTENSSQQQMSIILFRYAGSLHLLGLFICLQIVFLGIRFCKCLIMFLCVLNSLAGYTEMRKKRVINISKIFPPGDLLVSKGQTVSRGYLLILSDDEET